MNLKINPGISWPTKYCIGIWFTKVGAGIERVFSG
jgi:hypothetical protein